MKHLNFYYLSKTPIKFYRFTGVSVGEFLSLKEEIEPLWEEAERKLKFPIKKLSDKPISNLDQLREIFSDIYKIIVDATEQEIPRPKDKRKNKLYRSGKKKRHTLKTQIFIERKTGQILEVSPAVPGSIHDYKLFKMRKTGERLPKDKPIYLDKGYQGAKKDYPSLELFIPKKANRWHKLTQKDKSFNKILNSVRVKIEHSILKCKRFKVLKQIYRHPLKDYHQRFQIIAGIINFQLHNNKENLIPLSIPTFTRKEIVFSKV